jgi:hypothetical protein
MEGLTIGRIVHYVSTDPQHTAAIVTKIIDKENGVCNLMIFADLEQTFVREAIPYDQGAKFQTWHWPERA